MNRLRENEVIGSYKIVSKIAEGGMAEIYKALQPALKRTVVVKKLKDPNREIIARFKKEALLSAGFGHENLLAIYDFIYFERTYYLVMEHVEGEDLRTVIDFLSPVPPDIAAMLIMEIARGLEYTHAQNIIHRDIKPGNVLISYSGDVKLIDFGVAKDDTSTRLTMTGLIVGTPAYMSPEQATGEPLSPQSDLYALGTLLYELLTGIKPFTGEHHTEILAKITSNRYTPAERINPDIPHKLRRVLRRALRQERDKRYKNATEFIHDLENCISWQLRSRKKAVIAHFLRQLDKNIEVQSDDSIRAAMYIKGFGRIWSIMQNVVLILAAYIAVLFGFQFKSSELGYLKLNLPDTGLMYQVDDQKPHLSDSADPLIGPLLSGPHRVKVTNPEYGGTYINFCQIAASDTLSLNIKFDSRQDSAKISLLSNPSGADAYLDRVFIGKTPLMQTYTSPGHHFIEIRHPDYTPEQHDITIRASEPYTLSFQLKSIN